VRIEFFSSNIDGTITVISSNDCGYAWATF